MSSEPAIVDLSVFLNETDFENPSEETIAECQKLAKSLQETGIVIAKDPRVSSEDNATFLDMMERYYDQDDDIKRKDERPDIHYQLGVTPEFTEVPRDHTALINQLDGCNLAHIPEGADPKWRFHWRIGPQPETTEFPLLNADPVVPEAFQDEWAEKMDKWGDSMLDCCVTVAQMAAVGMGLDKDVLSDKMAFGPHLLAPTGSDLNKYGDKDTIFAGFHYDLNFLTCHGKSRFPGLFAWLRDGQKVPIKVPDGCLLLQAGAQFEYFTGGKVMAGFHEVVVADSTLERIEEAKANQQCLWRVSSTMFSHIQSDQTLEVLEPFAKDLDEETLAKYPPVKAGTQVQAELDAINLGEGKTGGKSSNSEE